MAYNIRLLGQVTLKPAKYLFDANLWIKILRPQFQLKENDKKYLEFLAKFKGNPQQPKIVVTALILSEVINRLLREVSMNDYLDNNPDAQSVYDRDPKRFYKETYRKTQHFLDSYQNLCDDIRIHEPYMEYVSDEFGAGVTASDILDNPVAALDFNDMYYYKLAKAKGYIVVTHDIDFFVEGVEIITNNIDLKAKEKNTIVPTGVPTTLKAIMEAKAAINPSDPPK